MLQVKQFQETLKESIAEERSACQDRVDRRAIRDRLEWGARQEQRDGQLLFGFVLASAIVVGFLTTNNNSSQGPELAESLFPEKLIQLSEEEVKLLFKTRDEKRIIQNYLNL